MGDHIPLIEKDLDAKHQAMHTAAFPFLRATFYRWMQRWPETCPELDATPEVLSVGTCMLKIWAPSGMPKAAQVA